MANNKSNTNLLDFLSQTFTRNRAVMIPQGASLVLCGTFIDKGKATRLGRDGQSTIDALSCEQHEEADTRIFAHAAE